MKKLWRMLIENPFTTLLSTAWIIVGSIIACTPAELRTIKSVFDIGVEACELFYGQHKELAMSLSPQDACKIAEVVQPFVDHISASEQQVGERSSAALKAMRAK